MEQVLIYKIGFKVLLRKIRNLFSFIATEFQDYFESIISVLPGVSGSKLRNIWLRSKLATLGVSPGFSVGIEILGAKGIHIGSNFACGRRCSLIADGNGQIFIGDSVALNSDVIINAAVFGKIYIGSNVLIGPKVIMRSSNHVYDSKDIPIRFQGHTPGVIKIGDDVWISGNVTILANVTIGKGAVVAAGAVVNSDVPPYSVVGGIPAKHLNWR